MEWLKRIPRPVDRVIVVMLVVTGLLLPWAVAIGVKLYLQAQGRPTVPWSDISAYALFFGPLGSVVAAAPLVILANLYRKWMLGKLAWFPRATPLQGRLVVLFGFAGCAAGMVHTFIYVFWEFDALVLWFIPGIVAMFLPWMAGGLAVGVVLAVISGFALRRNADARCRGREAGEGGGVGPDGRGRAAVSGGTARHRAGEDKLAPELAQRTVAGHGRETQRHRASRRRELP